MNDARWVSYFRRAVLLTMALPECGGATAPVAGSDAGSTTPSANDGSSSAPTVWIPLPEGAAAAVDSSAEHTFVPAPEARDATADSGCQWQPPQMLPSGCTSRAFAGDVLTCVGFLAAGAGDQCTVPCGLSMPEAAERCSVSTAEGGGWVFCGVCPGNPGNGGRRPLYFASLGFGAVPSGRELGTHFARAACMEAGSVEAFRWLRDELVAHGAPKRLVRGASRAIRDEIRHVRQTSALARRFGEEPIAAPSPPPRVVRSLAEMAIANAVEGCVRETYSTLECLWQGRRARDSVVRATMRRIARDEVRHLALSWAVHAWAMGRLSTGERARVADALREEIGTLKGELRADPHESLLFAGGLPRAFQSQALVDTIAAKIAA